MNTIIFAKIKKEKATLTEWVATALWPNNMVLLEVIVDPILKTTQPETNPTLLCLPGLIVIPLLAYRCRIVEFQQMAVLVCNVCLLWSYSLCILALLCLPLFIYWHSFIILLLTYTLLLAILVCQISAVFW